MKKRWIEPKQMSEEDLELDYPAEGRPEFTDDIPHSYFAHIEWQAQRIRELEEALKAREEQLGLV